MLRNNFSILVVLINLLATTQANDFPSDSWDIDKVREILQSENFETESKQLRDAGTKAFKAYSTLLREKRIDRKTVSRIFAVLYYVDGDKSMFLEPAIDWLYDRDPFLRADAIRLLERVGKQPDCVLLFAMLNDTMVEVRTAAATTISKIGGRTDMIALKLFLENRARSKSIADDEPTMFLGHVGECIRRMQERLQNEAKPKK